MSKGQSLVEIIVALGIFAIALGVTFGLLLSQFTSLEVTRSSLRAIARAEEGLEAARSIRDRGWASLEVGDHGLALSADQWVFQGTSDVEDSVSRMVTVASRSANEREVTVTTTWTPKLLRPRTITLRSILSNWRRLAAPSLTGDWQNPQVLGSVDIGAGNEGTSLAVLSSIVYLTADASDRKKDDFYIIDATDGTNPIILGRVNTGRGLSAVAIQGTFAYVAHDHDDDQLQIISLAVPGAPTLTSSLDLGDEKGRAVGVSGATVLLGTEADEDEELFFVNAANPLLPTVTSSFEIGDQVNDIFVVGTTAYIATSNDLRELVIIDFTNPAAPVQVGAVDVPGEDDGQGIFVNITDNRAYLVREEDGNHPTHAEMIVIDVTDPGIPTVLGALEFSEDINAVTQADELAFIATSLASEEFQIYDVSDPTAITYYSGLNFPQVANDIALENNVIYIAARSNDALRIITSQ